MTKECRMTNDEFGIESFGILSSFVIRNSSFMLNQPVALVTGGSRGIGRGICLELGRRGYAVAVNYAGNEQAARGVQQGIESAGGVSLCVQADVAVAGDRNRLVDQVLAAWGRVDLL